MRKIHKYPPRIIISAGEPAGIGPDLVIQIAQEQIAADLTVVGDPESLQARATLLGLPISLGEFNPGDQQKSLGNQPRTNVCKPGQIKIIPIKCKTVPVPGQLSVDNAEYVLQILNLACRKCLDGTFDAMVTAPVQKSVMNDAGYAFSGHTEYLAEICGQDIPVMMLANQTLRVALVTTHLPLSRVSTAITRARLSRVLKIVDSDLRQKFSIKQPHILVCALNPHAGEDGHLGHEERDIIKPVLNELRGSGLSIAGPQPADTAFTSENLKNIDVVVSMYHDQGLPVLKATGFGETVNITLGLPIIRTSVDHGTALHLAATGRASPASLRAAVHCAIQMVQRQAR